VARRLDKLYNNIKQNGWLKSSIRVMEDLNENGRYLCIDGMHRVITMQKLKRDDKDFKDFKIGAFVYSQMTDTQQCILADSFI
jgi:hypothetical protein